MKDKMILICSICGYDIAEVIPDTKIPLSGAMFTSKDKKHGFPAPWLPMTPWEYMFCPMCQSRPFGLPDDSNSIHLLTDQGEVLVTDKGISETFSSESDEDSSVEAVRPDIATDDQAAKDDATEAAGDPSEEPENDSPELDEPVDTIESMIESGEVVKNGSWYRYKNKSYYRKDLEKFLKG